MIPEEEKRKASFRLRNVYVCAYAGDENGEEQNII